MRCSRWMLLATAAFAWASGETPAQAQADVDGSRSAEPNQAAAPGEVSEVVVTGTRLGSAMNAPTPVVSSSAEELKAAAPGLISDALNQLPAFKGSSRSANAGISAVRGNGASLLSLRGLEPQRTLVLLDGRRVVSSSAAGSPDTNLFPQALVTRVEVVTGGASAAYGSDAVAGVVNFILDRNFTGVRLSAQAGTSSRRDGDSELASVAVGTPFGERGHFLASAEYSNQDEIGPPGGREWAEAGYAIIQNPSPPPTRLIAPSRVSNATFGGLIVGGPMAGLQFLPGGQLARFATGQAVTATTMVGGDGAVNEYSLTSGVERWTGFARANYELSDAIDVYVEAAYGQSTSDYAVARPSQTGATAYTVFADNAFLSADVRARMAAANITSFRLGRINRDWGFATADSRSRTWRGSAGFEYSLPHDWQLEAYYAHGENDYRVLTRDNTIHRRVFAAADAVVDPATGRVVCRSTLAGLDPGCVPLNILGEGAASPDALAWIRGTAIQNLELKQDVASIVARGAPVSLPAGDIRLAVGIEYRKEAARQTSDPLSRAVTSGAGVRGFPAPLNGTLGSFFLSNPQPLRGSYDVREVFAEAEAPLLRDSSFGRSLSINGAVRLVDYSTVGSVTVWKAGVVYQPTEELRFRATRSRDIRAANVAELFSSPVSTQGSVFYNGATTSWLGKRSGNPKLEPEKADTLTVGLIYRPQWAPSASLSVDYFDIDLQGAISQLTPQQTVDQCAAGFAPACEQISIVNGQLSIQIPTLNLAAIRTSGVDLEANYAADLWGGRVKLRGLLSYLDRFETTVPGVPTVNRAGDIGITGTPEFTGHLSISYSRGRLGLFLNERYVGSGKIDADAGPTTFIDNSVGAVWYTDLTLRWNPQIVGRDGEVFLTVNNLFDKDPPIVPTIPYGAYRATNFSLYDVVGRYFTIGWRQSF